MSSSTTMNQTLTKTWLDNLQTKIYESRRVFKIGDQYWITFYSAVEPKNPPSRNFRVYYPEHCWIHPHWFNDAHPFMAFTLSMPIFSGAIFGRLAGTLMSFEVKEVRKGKWALSRETQASWYRLESTLVQLYEFFLGRAGQTFLHTLDVKAFREPSRWGYRREHESEKLARIRVMNSRNAFVPLMALCTYAFACNRTCAPFDTEALVHVLVNEARVNPEWANELAQSQMMCTTEPRVGVYVDQQSFPSNLFRPMMVFRAPLWIRMSSRIPNPTDNAILRMKESDIENTNCRMKEAEGPVSTEQDLPTVTLALVDKRSKSSTTEAGSRQRPGETLDQFFARETKHREQLLEKETAYQRDVRQSRERSALAYICPGPHGAHVFEWINESGNFRRCRVARSEVPFVWDNYAQAQKRYNSARNEWDLCREFAPAAVSDAMSDYDDDFEVEPLGADEIEVISRTGVQQVSDTDVHSQYPPFVAATDKRPENPLIAFFPLSFTLYFKYGFVPEGRDVKDLIGDSSLQRYPSDLSLKILAEELDGSIPGSDVDKLSYFVCSYATSKPSPAGLCDLDDGHSHALRTHKSRLYAPTLEANNICRIVSTDSNGQIALFVPKASMGVEALRQPKCRAVQDLALYYICRGTPFDWRLINSVSNRTILQLPAGQREGLGFRGVSYVTTYYDYQAYVRRRNMLLRDRSIARAALQYGGIVWRLTVEAMSELHRNFDFQETLEEELEVVSLTQEDLGVICGMYKQWTETPYIYSESSWWPQAHQWIDSGADLGYWTRNNEGWFQMRGEGIRRGDFNCRTATQWRDTLKLHNKTKWVKKSNEDACTKFLASI